MEVKQIIVPVAAMGKPTMTRRDQRLPKRPCVERFHAWADLIRSVAGEYPESGKVELLTIISYVEPPKSYSKKKRHEAIGTIKRTKPDTSNILKGVEDVLWEDDEKIGKTHVEKYWAEESRTIITIDYLNGAEP